MTSFQQLKERRSGRQGPLVSRSSVSSSQAIEDEVAEVPDRDKENHAGPSTAPDRFDGNKSSMVLPSDTVVGTSDKESEIYQTASRGVRIEQRRGRGRGVFASRAFKPGENIYPITSRPPASVLSNQNLTSHCSACFLSARDAAILQRKEEEPLKRCSACRVTHYCSTTCSRDDWTYHKPECSAFQLLRKRHKEKFPVTKAGSLDFIPHESVRALGRLLWTKKRAKEVGMACTSWDEYCLLQSNIDPEADKLAKLREQAHRLAYYIGLSSPHLLEAGSEMALSLLLKEYGIEGKPELELMKMWSRYQTNAFTLDSPDLDALGVVVAPALAMANHSCEPNAVVVFPKGKGLGQIIAIRPIDLDEEVLVCYIDVASPHPTRRSELRERYGFTCDCKLCQKEEHEAWVDPRWSVLHPGCSHKGKGRMPQSISWNRIRPRHSSTGRQVGFAESVEATAASRCDACGQAFAVEETKLVGLLERAKGLLEADENGSLDAADTEIYTTIDNARAMTTQLSSLCPASTHPLIPLNRLLTRLLTSNPPTSLQTLSVPLHHLTLALEGARSIYTAHHPTLAILLAQKARLLGIQFPLTEEELSGGRSPEVARNEMQRMQAALIAYREAVKACQGCFGRDGGIVGMGLQQEMEGLEREIGAMRIITSV